jgi:hypothetical protein
MAKKRRTRRRRAARSHRRRNYRRRSNPLFALAPRRHRRRSSGRHRRRSHRRRSNPGLSSFAQGGMLKMIGGAAAGFFGANALPSLIPQLAQYNVGVMGYGLNLGSGLLISWAAKRFVGPQAGLGALVGTGLSVLMRIIKDHAASTGSATSAAMSGDLAYYVSDRFPFPQGDGGPYTLYPGNPSLLNPPFPATSAAAVRAGSGAAAAALTAPAMHGIATGRWGVDSSGTASRWQ